LPSAVTHRLEISTISGLYHIKPLIYRDLEGHLPPLLLERQPNNALQIGELYLPLSPDTGGEAGDHQHQSDQSE
jgi:hypothetical protein